MELLLDMSNRIQVMKEFVAQHTLTVNNGPILKRSCDHARLDGTTTTTSTRVATGCMESSGTIALRVADEHVLEWYAHTPSTW